MDWDSSQKSHPHHQDHCGHTHSEAIWGKVGEP